MRLRSLFLSTLILVLPLPLLAETIYTYTGNPFTQAFAPYTTSESVTGYFTTASPLAPNLDYGPIIPTAFSFSNGLDTFSNLTPSLTTETAFYISTDADGNLTNWSIFLQAGKHDVYTRKGGDGGVIEIQDNRNQFPIADIPVPGLHQVPIHYLPPFPNPPACCCWAPATQWRLVTFGVD